MPSSLDVRIVVAVVVVVAGAIVVIVVVYVCVYGGGALRHKVSFPTLKLLRMSWCADLVL